jgi:hypothetical protein
MRKPILSVIICAIAAAILGCLEFDEQTVYVEHDRANDRLILIFNYMGLFAGKADTHSDAPSPKDLDESKKQLAEALAQHTVAVVDTWPFAASVDELRKEEVEGEPEYLRKRFGWILDEITVRNGGFYTDPSGRLCAAQVVTVEHASRTVPLINRVINGGILYEARKADDLTERIALDHARHGQDWLALKGHALDVSYPMAEADFADGRDAFADWLLQAVEDAAKTVRDSSGGTVDDEPDLEGRLVSLRDFVASPILVWHEGDLLRVRLGYESMPSELVVLPVRGDYRPNLAEHVAQTYGLHLDANLARYLLEPDAPAETEEQEAARVMAPRLTQRQRARVLVHALDSGPSDALRKKLRDEPLPKGVKARKPKPSDGELLALWREWLQSRPAPRAKD